VDGVLEVAGYWTAPADYQPLPATHANTASWSRYRPILKTAAICTGAVADTLAAIERANTTHRGCAGPELAQLGTSSIGARARGTRRLTTTAARARLAPRKVACNRCERRGQPRTDRLLAAHGARCQYRGSENCWRLIAPGCKRPRYATGAACTFRSYGFVYVSAGR
jgi:hypothetical protein